MNLSMLSIGTKAIIDIVSAKGMLQQKLCDMGFLSGKVVEVVRLSPLSDPMEVLVEGSHIGIRKEEAVFVMLKEGL